MHHGDDGGSGTFTQNFQWREHLSDLGILVPVDLPKIGVYRVDDYQLRMDLLDELPDALDVGPGGGDG